MAMTNEKLGVNSELKSSMNVIIPNEFMLRWVSIASFIFSLSCLSNAQVIQSSQYGIAFDTENKQPGWLWPMNT